MPAVKGAGGAPNIGTADQSQADHEETRRDQKARQVDHDHGSDQQNQPLEILKLQVLHLSCWARSLQGELEKRTRYPLQIRSSPP